MKILLNRTAGIFSLVLNFSSFSSSFVFGIHHLDHVMMSSINFDHQEFTCSHIVTLIAIDIFDESIRTQYDSKRLLGLAWYWSKQMKVNTTQNSAAKSVISSKLFLIDMSTSVNCIQQNYYLHLKACHDNPYRRLSHFIFEFTVT